MTKTLLQLQRPHSLQHQFDLWMTRYLVRRAASFNAQRQHRMAIYANDLIGIDINQFGVYERPELELLFRFLEPLLPVFEQGLALDIGGNIGNHALWFSRYFRAVHAFEPNPATFELLRFNSRWVSNLQLHALGLGDQPGTFEMEEDPENFGGSAIRQGGKAGTGRSVQIRVERLDDLPIDTTDLCFMKIDVEGFESKVLQGAAQTIRQRQPLVVFEQHTSEFVNGSTPSIEMLRAWGYRFCWQAADPLPGTWLGRRWRNLSEMQRGRRCAIQTADQVPCINHSMLVAVPLRFQTPLGLVA